MKKDIETKYLKCAKKDEVQEILKSFHDVSGHDGINSMFSHISSEFYWKGMSRDVKEYVSGYLLFHMQLVYPKFGKKIPFSFFHRPIRYT